MVFVQVIAFDCLPHEIVLVKLHAYGVDIKSLKFWQDYLSNRTQRIKLDSTFSPWLKILLGVLQGSILGLLPLFFNIFLNDMLWFVEYRDVEVEISKKPFRWIKKKLEINS